MCFTFAYCRIVLGYSHVGVDTNPSYRELVLTDCRLAIYNCSAIEPFMISD